MRIVTEKVLLMPKLHTLDFEGLCANAACEGAVCDQCIFGNLNNFEAAREIVNSDGSVITKREGRRTK